MRRIRVRTGDCGVMINPTVVDVLAHVGARVNRQPLSPAAVVAAIGAPARGRQDSSAGSASTGIDLSESLPYRRHPAARIPAQGVGPPLSRCTTSRVTSTRELTPSFRKTDRRWKPTV